MDAPAARLHLLVSSVLATRSRLAMLVEPSTAVLRPKAPATSQPQSFDSLPRRPKVPCQVSVSWKNWRGPGSARRRWTSTIFCPVGLVGLLAEIARLRSVPGVAIWFDLRKV